MAVELRSIAIVAAGFTMVVLPLLPTTAAAQQRLQGKVLGEHDSLPIPGARVLVLDSEMQILREVRSDRDGRWSTELHADRGPVQLGVQAEGFNTWLSSLLPGRSADVLTVLRALPASDSASQVEVGPPTVDYELEPVDVTVTPTYRFRGMEGFMRRREFGIGEFFGHEELRRLPVSRLGDLLQQAGLRLATAPSPVPGSYKVKFRGKTCTPRVWVDGVERRGDWSAVELSSLMISGLRAVEVYRGSEVPAEFYDPAVPACVTIVAWTR